MASFIEQLIQIASEAYSPKERFLDALEKAGRTGEGSRGGHIVGHTASGKPIYASGQRLAYPGEEAHKQEPSKKTVRTYIPPEGVMPHYSDSTGLKAYKNLIAEMKRRGHTFEGKITFDPKTDQIKTLSPDAASIVRGIIKEISAPKQPQAQ